MPPIDSPAVGADESHLQDSSPSRADKALFDGIQSFVAGHTHLDMERFRPGVANWGDTYSPASACMLPASDYLDDALSQTIPETHELVARLAANRDELRWEQTYTKADSAISETMLSRYGFVELIGSEGPYVSQKVRSGIGVYGPEIGYPPHRHKAEEIYIVLAGSAEFQLDGNAPRTCTAGDVVYVPSSLVHGFQTAHEAMVVFYIWQSGDLREVSTFV